MCSVILPSPQCGNSCFNHWPESKYPMAALNTKTELTPLRPFSQDDFFDILDECNISSDFENDWSPGLLGSLISDPAGFGVVSNDALLENHSSPDHFASHFNTTELLCKNEPIHLDYHLTTNAVLQTSSVTPACHDTVERHTIEGSSVTPAADVTVPTHILKMDAEVKAEGCCSPVSTIEMEDSSIKKITEQESKKESRTRGRPRRLDCHSCGDGPRNMSKKDDTKKPIKMKKTIHLWEFLEQILEDKTLSPRYITWVKREEGIFRLVNSRKVAQLWGQRKNKRNMTYEKMSRAMRYYYDRGILYHVNGQKLIYRFGDDVMSRRQDSTSDSESSEKSV